MEKYVINGGKPLCGEVTVSGAKNAAVAIIPATILAQGPCLLENIPEISDVDHLFEILTIMGATVRPVSGTSVFIDTSDLCSHKVPEELARQLRASYYFLGALMGRFGEADVPLPGGC
ncbi:MAG TPA: UDP-N-acetylglucosamine 1-carboxyvinyltransferase, partial [Oscillospiraceae bacterium]|nr:UDP-N-acetylglucosamine 1-carboxyvinyltransferase [Oscillospiraceae bacterium]